MYIYIHYGSTSRSLPKSGNCAFGPTEQLRRRTTRFSRALEVVSSNDDVKGGYANEGTQRAIMKMVISHTNSCRHHR